MYITELPYHYSSDQAEAQELTRIKKLIRECKIAEKPVLTRYAKRLIDIAVAMITIVFVLSWFTPVIGIIIWLETKENIFFIQKRNGLQQVVYSCIKFRTMYRNDLSDAKAATDDDTRITKAGRFLRISGLDELPQMFNVLKGDMSLVGPRPHMISDNEAFERKIEGYNKRHLVKPGISGLAQVKGYKGPVNSELEMYKRIENDMLYAQNYSVWMDVKIMALTIEHMIKETSKL